MRRVMIKQKIPAAAGLYSVPGIAGAALMSAGFIGMDLFVWALSPERGQQTTVQLLVVEEEVMFDLPEGTDIMMVGRAEREPVIVFGAAWPDHIVFHIFQVVRASADVSQH